MQLAGTFSICPVPLCAVCGSLTKVTTSDKQPGRTHCPLSSWCLVNKGHVIETLETPLEATKRMATSYSPLWAARNAHRRG